MSPPSSVSENKLSKKKKRESGSKMSNRLAEILNYVGKSGDTQYSKSVPVGSPVGQKELPVTTVSTQIHESHRQGGD
jgi:hypothetical protein